MHCTIGGAVLGGAVGTPNIRNLAVSPAKQNLYVVGSFAAWSGMSAGSRASWTAPEVNTRDDVGSIPLYPRAWSVIGQVSFGIEIAGVEAADMRQ